MKRTALIGAAALLALPLHTLTSASAAPLPRAAEFNRDLIQQVAGCHRTPRLRGAFRHKHDENCDRVRVRQHCHYLTRDHAGGRHRHAGDDCRPIPRGPNRLPIRDHGSAD